MDNIKALVEELLERARIRRQIPSRKSVQEGKPDRIADLLERAAAALAPLAEPVEMPTGDHEEIVKHLREEAFDCPLCVQAADYTDNLRSALERALHQLERAYSVLDSYGVPKERAKSVGNGIQVLITRCDKELSAATASAEDTQRMLEAEHDAHMECHRKAEASAVPGGYVVVPGEPTEEMYRLCDPVIGAKWPHTTYECAGFIYKAMLSAAPPAAAGWKETVAALAGKDAHPHTDRCGFDRNGSHNAGHYVCMCGWEDTEHAATIAAARRGR